MSAPAILLLLLSSAPQAVQEKTAEPVVRVNLLDNGDFGERNDSATGPDGVRPIPWWRSAKGMEQVVALPEGGFALKVGRGEWAEQPVACYAPATKSVRVHGKVGTGAIMALIDGSGVRHVSAFSGRPELSPSDFEFTLAEASSGGVQPLPRITLRLEGVREVGTLWQDLALDVDLPCPTDKALRVEIVALLREIIEPWLKRGLDDEGPRKTGLLCHTFDAVTGERLATFQGGFYPLWEQLNDALEVEEVPEWRAALEGFLEDYLTLCIQPETGLPRSWDVVKDEPIVDLPAGNLSAQMSFLIDVAERGPKRFRERARAAAIRMGEAVLKTGLQPDGTIGASYFPLDGSVNTSVPPIRRFDVLAQLARLSALSGDVRYLRAAKEALSTFEFTHYWAGTWDYIDPGFDDDFGNYGARAATIALAHPEGRIFQRFAREGFEHYADLWRDALRLGGNVAADQVRCWNALADIAKLEPQTRPRISELLRMAARSHFKGEQYGDGAWGDVTILGFDPQTTVKVGDYTGTPQNLLNGLATIYSDDLGLRTDEVRGMYTAVLRSSVTAYQRPYGFLLDHGERKGNNPAVGSIRMLLGLVKMLRKLS